MVDPWYTFTSAALEKAFEKMDAEEREADGKPDHILKQMHQERVVKIQAAMAEQLKAKYKMQGMKPQVPFLKYPGVNPGYFVKIPGELLRRLQSNSKHVVMFPKHSQEIHTRNLALIRSAIEKMKKVEAEIKKRRVVSIVNGVRVVLQEGDDSEI